MLRHVLIPVLVGLSIVAPAASAENLLGDGRRPPSSDRAVRPAVPDDRKKELDTDFAALAAAKTEQEAHGPEQRILAVFNRSGSDTVDLLMGWASEAFVEKNYPQALDLLDEAVALKPDYAEAYNRRATVFYATEDYRRALADIRTTLALEPRHFGALTGLAAILAEIGDRDRAIEIYGKILKLHPTMEAAKTGLEKLKKEGEGSPI